ncbi:hypothetical protein TUM4438_34400 [Shewanella sairae]|uniref:General secretion pathway protein GspM n=1 Tax=Shewanella sairae TaxID=190310 RepID=A0ABQ4PPL8_9GAMM|nr:hypothetical protein [Shewanella sairae]MCL1131406.1 hypothetical protein [Shewanella sairae]GIU49868.1 hypothetical protein TUM4438_34400 [Shewanella sairae]
MQDLLKYKHYLIMIGILVLAKFVWVPLWDTKEQNWQQQASTQQNLNKTLALLSLKDEMAKKQRQMANSLQLTESKFADTTDVTSYKLTAQSELESLFKHNQLVISSSNWRDGIANDDIQTLLLDIRFTGELKAYLQFLQQLKAKPELSNVSLESNQLTIRGQTKHKLGSVNGQISLKLAVKLLTEEAA